MDAGMDGLSHGQARWITSIMSLNRIVRYDTSGESGSFACRAFPASSLERVFLRVRMHVVPKVSSHHPTFKLTPSLRESMLLVSTSSPAFMLAPDVSFRA